MSKETKVKSKFEKKIKRLTKAGPLYIDQSFFEEGYHYRIVNDTPGKIKERERMGYEIVIDPDIEVGDQNANVPGRLESAVIIEVGRDTSMKAVLMRIPNEDHQEILDEINDSCDNQAEQVQLNEKANNPTLYGEGIYKTN